MCLHARFTYATGIVEHAARSKPRTILTDAALATYDATTMYACLIYVERFPNLSMHKIGESWIKGYH